MALIDNIVSYWKLEEASGNRADAAGSNTLTDNNTVTNGAGIIDDGAYFASANSEYLSNGSPTGIPTGANARTFNFWFKAVSIGVAKSFFFFGAASTNNMQSCYNNGTFLSYNGYGNDLEYNSASFSADTWYMITCKFDGTTAKLYVNAAEVASGDKSSWNTSSGAFQMGVENTSNYFLNGAMDEFGIWSRALSDAEITELYNSGAGLQYPFSTSEIKTINGLAKASVKEVNGLAIASVKNWNGLA